MMGLIRRWLLWWWARRDQPSEFRFPQALRDAKRVLILMPAAIDAMRQSEVFLSRVPRAFPKSHVTLLYPPNSMVARFYNPHGFQCVVPDSKQVGWLGVPRRRFLRKMFEKPYDVLISLNREPSVYLGAMTISSKAAVRIGLPDGMGKPFVNVELRHGRERADIKTEFILFIEMIRKLASEPSVGPVRPNSPKLRPLARSVSARRPSKSI